MENQFAFSGECKNKKYAMDVIRETAEAWDKLITGKTESSVRRANATISYSPDRTNPPNVPTGHELPAAPIDPSIDKWFFISGAAV